MTGFVVQGHIFGLVIYVELQCKVREWHFSTPFPLFHTIIFCSKKENKIENK